MANPVAKILPKKLANKWFSDAITIPVVRMSGVIAASTPSPLASPTLSLASVAGPLETAFDMKKAPAVAIVINSPGGSPVQSRLIYRRIRDLAKEKGKKVHVYVEDVAASGGYMIACAGDDISVDPSSIVGSIGVVSASFGFVDAIDKLGIKRRVYTAGQNKSVLDPFLPEKKEDIARLKELQLTIHDVFIDLVKESRGDKLSDDEGLFTGMFWTGAKGLELGLVDQIADIRSSLKARYGADTEMKLVEPKKNLFGRKTGSGISLAGLGGVEPSAIAASATDGVITSLEQRALWSRYGL